MRIVFAVFLIFILIAGCGGGENPPERGRQKIQLEGRSVLMVIAHTNYQDVEYLTIRDGFESKGVRVTVASTDTTMAHGMGGGEVKPDILLANASIPDHDALVIVGGSGVEALWDNEVLHHLVKEAGSKGRPIGAICLAPVVLAKAGLLQGKKATVFSSASKQLEEGGAIYTKQDVVIDGQIVTGEGPEAARKFTRALGKLMLQSEVQ